MDIRVISKAIEDAKDLISSVLGELKTPPAGS
jgi:hypothetical protein